MLHTFKTVSLLITHYNRSKSLERLLSTFKTQECFFEEIIVSDDGSKAEHIDAIKELQNSYNFRLITTSNNKGLGNNINKGQDEVKTPYTLYVQEDFEPQASFASHFSDAMHILDTEPELDMVRFYAYLKYPYLKPYKKGFSKMVIKPWFTNYKKIYYYSDHPHIRRSTFFQKFGRYAEGLNVDRTEYKMCVSFIKNKGTGLFYDDYKALFNQVNSTSEPSTATRISWKNSENPLIAIVRDVYRQLKYNFDLLF